jgi:hypothetical protein
VRDGVRYLERAQNRDGGFGGAPGQPSSQLITGWTVIGLEAAGRHPLDVRSSGHDPIGYMRAGARTLSDTGELERTIIALRGAGRTARRFAGRDLVGELLARQRPDGSFDRQSTLTAFAILALRADRRRRALSFLRSAQSADGGFGQTKGYRSNAQSTAWVVQGLVAARRSPRAMRRGGRTPLAYLASLQAGDGSFRYSRTSTQTPVWVTAQAIAALARRPFPVRPPERARRSSTAPRSSPARRPERRARRARRRAVEHGPTERRAATSSRTRNAGRRIGRPVTTLPAAEVAADSREDGSGGVPTLALAAAGVLGAACALWLARRRLR